MKVKTYIEYEDTAYLYKHLGGRLYEIGHLVDNITKISLPPYEGVWVYFGSNENKDMAHLMGLFVKLGATKLKVGNTRHPGENYNVYALVIDNRKEKKDEVLSFIPDTCCWFRWKTGWNPNTGYEYSTHTCILTSKDGKMTFSSEKV